MLSSDRRNAGADCAGRSTHQGGCRKCEIRSDRAKATGSAFGTGTSASAALPRQKQQRAKWWRTGFGDWSDGLSEAPRSPERHSACPSNAVERSPASSARPSWPGGCKARYCDLQQQSDRGEYSTETAAEPSGPSALPLAGERAFRNYPAASSRVRKERRRHQKRLNTPAPRRASVLGSGTTERAANSPLVSALRPVVK